MRIDLSDRNVLVTGGSRGIGAAIARAFAGAGARVGVHYGRNADAAERLVEEIGGDSAAFGADLEDPQEALRLWTDVVARFGRVDVLVNNAGVAVASPLDAVDDRWIAEWNRTQAVNLLAVGILCRSAIAHFTENGGGRIVNIASRAAHRGDTPDYFAYAASKGGVVALTKSIARFCGKDGITAFAVAPGFTRTEMAQDFIDQYGEDYAMKDIALPRMTEPEDIAPSVVFLASGLADHATGTTIDLNAASYVR
jgi:NAD(P)-dependent dehydrogenase (short-subunit alcohol dehydrogenase family)